MGGSAAWIGAGIVVAAAVVIGFAWKPLRARARAREVSHAIRQFRLHREMLEAKFFDMASALGKPRGLRWLDCHWHSGVTFGRDRQTGLITAFAAVNISFEAIEGGDMEDVAAVDTIRDAAALFHYQAGRWGTGGRALFNLNPQDALKRMEDQFEPIAEHV